MYLLYLTTCTLTTGIFGITTNCVTITPASYVTLSLCKAAGKQYVAAVESKDIHSTYTCEKH